MTHASDHRRYKAAILVFEIDANGKQIPGTGVGLQLKSDLWHDTDVEATAQGFDPLMSRVWSALCSLHGYVTSDTLHEIAKDFAERARARIADDPRNIPVTPHPDKHYGRVEVTMQIAGRFHRLGAKEK